MRLGSGCCMYVVESGEWRVERRGGQDRKSHGKGLKIVYLLFLVSRHHIFILLPNIKGTQVQLNKLVLICDLPCRSA